MIMNKYDFDVSIIYVNYKTAELTINSIKSVMEKTSGLNYEIFVVDNNSQDGSIEAIEKEFPNINIIKSPTNGGFAVANNLAMRQAKGKYIFCLNTDTLLVNNAVKIMFDFMEKDENQNIGACGGNLYHQDLTPAHGYANFHNVWNCSAVYWLIKYFFKKHFEPVEIKTVKDVDYVAGADLLMRHSVLDEVGLYDETFFMYSEDADLCKRIRMNNYGIVIVPDAKIIHLEGRNKANFLSRTGIAVQGKYHYLWKYKMFPTIFVMKISYCILHFFMYLFTFNPNHKDLFFIHLKS